MRLNIVSFIAVYCVLSSAGAVSLNINEPKTVRADKIEYNVKTESIKTSGNTEITNASGQRLTLTDSYLSKTGDDLAGDDIKLWLGNHMYVETDSFTRNGDITIANDALFTACKGCDPYGDAWHIYAQKIEHNSEKQILKFNNMVFWTYDLPVLWLPYFSMPDPSVKHKSGLLMPNFKSTNKMGTQINIPVYIALSDYHDLTITTSYLTEENPLFQIEHRLNRDHSEYRTNGAYTHNRDGQDRWFIFNNDVIELGENARASIYLERTSDKTFLQKYGFYSDQPYLDSGAKLELFGQTGYVVADTHIFQELRASTGMQNTVSGDILPNIRGVYQTTPLFAETYATFNTDILGISADGTASQRVIGDARITSPWTLWGGNRITGSISARYDLYNFEHTDMINAQQYSGLKNRFLPSGYVEWGLPLFNPQPNWTHILEPRARLTIKQHTSKNQFAENIDSAGALLSDVTLFSNNRFAGLDLWENGTYADYGMRWAAFDNNGHNTEIFIGQSYDFTDRANTDPNSGFRNGASDYVGRIAFNNMKWADISSRFRLSQTDLSLRHIETSAVVGTNANFINIGHIWSQQFDDTFTIEDEINEITAGTGIQLADRWSVRFNAIYNVTRDRFQRHTGGIYYNHPCYYLSLEYRRDNAIKQDYVGNTTFQFKFGISIDGQRY